MELVRHGAGQTPTLLYRIQYYTQTLTVARRAVLRAGTRATLEWE